jgi:hypothetical protein
MKCKEVKSIATQAYSYDYLRLNRLSLIYSNAAKCRLVSVRERSSCRYISFQIKKYARIG